MNPDIDPRYLTYVLWRIDGDFTLTVLNGYSEKETTNDTLYNCIMQEVKDNTFTEEEALELIDIALNYDSSNFIGYEMPIRIRVDKEVASNTSLFSVL